MADIFAGLPSDEAARCRVDQFLYGQCVVEPVDGGYRRISPVKWSETGKNKRRHDKPDERFSDNLRVKINGKDFLDTITIPSKTDNSNWSGRG